MSKKTKEEKKNIVNLNTPTIYLPFDNTYAAHISLSKY